MLIVNRTSRVLGIAETGQFAEPSVPVDVREDVAERLLEQQDVWGRGGDVCDVCGFVAASPAGLKSHERSHTDDQETDR